MHILHAFCLLLASAATAAQTPAPTAPTTPDTPASEAPVATLKVNTRVVEIAAVVTSKSGEPRGGLTRDDFILRQDGKEEPIRYFSQGSELPLTIALLVDTSGSQRSFIGDEARASDIFFETVLGRPQDRATLIQFDTRVVELRPLTPSTSALHLSLLNLNSGSGANSAGTLLADAVFATSRDILAREPGRKAIILLTDGGDNGSRKSLADAIEQAQRADVEVYSIRYSLSDLFSGGPGGVPHGPDPGAELLKKLSEATGGRTFNVSRNLPLREIFTDIAADLRLQYELGYTPPPDTQPNTFHKLDIRPRDKGLLVQARKGFFAQP